MDDEFDLEDLEINDDAYIEKVCENAIDYSEYFTTTTIFSTRKAMLDWVIEVGKMHNMVIIIARSQVKVIKATLTCERAGKYRLSKSGVPVDVEKFTGTKKMMCPFRLQAKEHVGGGWSVFVRHGIHNHKLPDYNEGRAIISKLSKDDLSLVQELSKSHVQPHQIMNILKTVNKKTLITVKHIYNARQKFKTESLGGRSVMQQLMKLIVDNGYIQWHREEVGTDVVRDIFFAHPNVISMLRLFHYVLIVDCTYKTNKYKMPFLEIVGMVPTGKNFAIGFAWLKDEQRGSYEWALSYVC
ncbi:protein FAR1-RELATED SEQUENCE 5-like [Chenopodium quinoa]|uniref:protein FAR1-RELATED SEQUENCE 5-like n=1 Tax=Chenopodium quinoa TaxID=63459 RepID=UPI000B77D776|nr:protein FAR1-RELATED SEQUENCE 5-like [Chenopodium quinoa]